MCSSGDKQLRNAETAQANFTKTLQSNYSQDYAKQQDALDFLNGKLNPLIEKPTGYSPEALTSMRTGATENVGRSYAQAEQALHNQEAMRGGNGLPSGVDAQLEAENANEGARLNADTQNQITQADENLKQQNFWNAINAKNGVAAEFNPNAAAGEANSGSGETANLGSAYQSSKKGFWSDLASSFASGLGSGLGGGFGKGVGGQVAKRI